MASTKNRKLLPMTCEYIPNPIRDANHQHMSILHQSSCKSRLRTLFSTRSGNEISVPFLNIPFSIHFETFQRHHWDTNVSNRIAAAAIAAAKLFSAVYAVHLCAMRSEQCQVLRRLLCDVVRVKLTLQKYPFRAAFNTASHQHDGPDH